MESRIRTLVQDLENTDIILTAHPHVKGIGSTFICTTEEEQAAASQGELSADIMKRKEEDYEGKEYRKVFTRNFFIGLEIDRKPSETPCEPLSMSLADGNRGRIGQSGTEPVIPKQTVLCGMPSMGQVR